MSSFLQWAIPVVGALAVLSLVALVVCACVAAGRADDLLEQYQQED